jgi:hypothetical protein
MDLLDIGLSVVDWIGLAQDRYRWKALVNSVMNIRVPKNAGNLPKSAHLVAYQVILSSTELVSSLVFTSVHLQILVLLDLCCCFFVTL